MLACEMWLDRVARILDMPPEHVRRLNFLEEGEETHFGQIMECNQVCTSERLQRSLSCNLMLYNCVYCLTRL